MTCIKTGAYVHLAEYGTYARGDVYQEGNVLILRLCPTEFEPNSNVKHFTIYESTLWFDNNDPTKYSTMVVAAWTNHGYEGVPING